MKKCVAVILSVCVFLGVLGYAQPTLAQEVKESKTEALLKYQAEKKSPWQGVGLVILPVPSLGHVYAEDWWPRGAKFIGLYLASLMLMSNKNTRGIGLFSLVGFKAWEFIDVYWAVKDYNKKLARKYGIELSINLNQNRYLDRENGVQVALSYRF